MLVGSVRCRLDDQDSRRRVQQSARRRRQQRALEAARRVQSRRPPLVLHHHEQVTVRDMARKLGVKMDDIQRQLAYLGDSSRAEPDLVLELDTAELLALEFGRKVERPLPERDAKALR